MAEQERIRKIKHFAKLVVENFIRFFISVSYVFIFQMLFGVENTLTGVAISVGFTMLPLAPVGIRPRTLVGIIMVLYIGGGFVGQMALVSPWVALPVNFIFTVLILVLSREPLLMQPAISFLLCFIFSQSTPVPWAQYPLRLLCTVAGAASVAVATLIVWKKLGIGFKGSGRMLKEQVGLCGKNRSYILRMALGLSIAMLAGMLLGLKKPLWISIVVMSLTQPELRNTLERIRYRLLGTLLGIVVFLVVFVALVPHQYAFAVIMLIGYISYFMPEYKHKQVVNAVNALNASLVLFDTNTAVANRVSCLLGGVIIVLAVWAIEKGIKGIRKTRALKRGVPSPAADGQGHSEDCQSKGQLEAQPLCQ